MELFLDALLGLLIAFVVAGFAYKKGSLSVSGFLSAVWMGTIIFACGGWLNTIVLLTFFISSSIISEVGGHQEKHSSRTYKQVLANGIVGTIMIVLFYVTKDTIYQLLFGLSIAIATADTWAGEIGMMSSKQPRNILSWKKMTKGMSGGVTTLGLFVSMLGGILISAFYGFSVWIIIGAFVGSMVDSILGTVQVKYVSDSGEISDDLVGVEPCIKTIGIRWLSNNLVNVLSNVLVVIAVYVILSI